MLWMLRLCGALVCVMLHLVRIFLTYKGGRKEGRKNLGMYGNEKCWERRRIGGKEERRKRNQEDGRISGILWIR